MGDVVTVDIAAELAENRGEFAIPYTDEVIPHECGVAAIYNPNAQNIGQQLVGMLVELQHRGKTSAGATIYSDDGNSVLIKDEGKVAQVFPENEPNILDEKVPNARIAMGQVRWATSGGREYAHPFEGEVNDYRMESNGEVTNTPTLIERYKLEPDEDESDTSIVNRILDIEITRNEGDAVAATEIVMNQLEGGFVFMVATQDTVIAARDPWGTRPAYMAQYLDGSIRMASETVAFETAADTEKVPYVVDEIGRGQIVVINESGISYRQMKRVVPERDCPFEYIYFSSPNARRNGRTIENIREDMGLRLGQKMRTELDKLNASLPPKLQVKPDGFIGAPNSAIPGARGCAKGMDVPFIENALIKLDKERSYTADTTEERQMVLDEKLVMSKAFVEWVPGKVLYIGDDSIVEGMTMEHLVKWLYGAGAKEVHVVVFSPKIVDECHMGARIRSDGPGLIAQDRDDRDIAAKLGADSVTYLELDDMAASIGKPLGQLCTACFTSEYHIDTPKRRKRDGDNTVQRNVYRQPPRTAA